MGPLHGADRCHTPRRERAGAAMLPQRPLGSRNPAGGQSRAFVSRDLSQVPMDNFAGK